MPQPTPYLRSFSYTGFAASYPAAQQPGDTLDAEFDALGVTLGGVLANLAKIQRDDGKLANQSVNLEMLTPDVMLALGAGVIWLPRGAWVTATNYAVSDVVTSGTGTYVCSSAHSSAALFATDFAAGRWTRLFDAAGSTPNDNSVSTVKLVDGSVTTPKIGFTSLDLAGTIRGGGIYAGTATTGVMRAKLAAGDVFVQAERTTDAQGAVGFQAIGVGATWDICQPDDQSTFNVRLNGADIGRFTANGFDGIGAVRAVAGAHPTAGLGTALGYVGGVGYVTAYDYDTAGWIDLKVRGKTVKLQAGGVDVANVTATGMNVVGDLQRGGLMVGYLDIPGNSRNGAYTLAASDRGKRIFSKNTAGQIITIPAFGTDTPPVDAVIVIRNRGTNPITLTPAAGVSLRMVGSATIGARAIAAEGMATLIHEETDHWVVIGQGVS